MMKTEQHIPDHKEDGRVLRGEATREKVLDAAERLFADHGYEGVSIRQIAKEAGVSLSVVGFHGGSKDDLFVTIIDRRAASLNEARGAALARVTAEKGAALSHEDIMAAYILPYTRMATSGERQWKAYTRLIARIALDERWYPKVRDLFDPTASEFLHALATLNPETPRDRLAAAFVLTVTSMLSIMSSRPRVSALSSTLGQPAPDDPDWLAQVLVDYCLGGLARATRQS